MGILRFFRRKFDLSYEDAVDKIIKGAVLIDVRRKEEYKSGHAKGSINISLEEIGRIENTILDKDKEIILYCRSGNRSEQGKIFLKKLGYKNTFNLGGLMEWKGIIE